MTFCLGYRKYNGNIFLTDFGHSSTSDSCNRLKGSLSCWLIDSGASHDVNGNFDLLSNMHIVTICSLRLPNYKQVVSIMKGDVKPCYDIVL